MNRDYGFFFKWDEEEEVMLLEKNKIFEERIEELVVEIRRMSIKISKLKAVKEENCRNRRREDKISAVKVLKQYSKLRSKVIDKKHKKVKIVQEMNALREESLALKMKGSRNRGGEKLRFILALALAVVTCRLM